MYSHSLMVGLFRFLALSISLIVALIALLLLVYLVGLLTPHIDSGVNQFPTQKKALARTAYEWGDLYVVGPDGLFVSGIMVKSVRVCPVSEAKTDDACLKDCDYRGGTSSSQGVRAEVEMYTLFGLPYCIISVKCDGASITRNF